MSRSFIPLNNNDYLDSKGIVHDRQLLSEILDDLYYKSGDVVTNIVQSSGFVTTAITDVFFFISLGKSMKNINTITFQSLSIAMRGVNGYLDNVNTTEYVNKSNYLITYAKINDTMLQVRIRKSSAWTSATNNTPFGVLGTVRMLLT